MEAQNKLRALLKEQLLVAQTKNPNYSLRAFSKDLDCSAPALSEFINSKRNFSAEKACRILLNSKVDRSKTKQLLESLIAEKTRTYPFGKKVEDLKIETYEALSDWYYLAIIYLTETKGFKFDIDFISDRLGVQKRQVKKAVDLLLKLGLLKIEKNKLIKTDKHITTSDDYSSQALKLAHAKTLDLSKKALNDVVIEKRDITAMTFAIDSKKIPEAKIEIRKFYKKMSRLLETEPKDEVYKLCVQLIPLSHEIKNNKKGENK